MRSSIFFKFCFFVAFVSSPTFADNQDSNLSQEAVVHKVEIQAVAQSNSVPCYVGPQYIIRAHGSLQSDSVSPSVEGSNDNQKHQQEPKAPQQPKQGQKAQAQQQQQQRKPKDLTYSSDAAGYVPQNNPPCKSSSPSTVFLCYPTAPTCQQEAAKPAPQAAVKANPKLAEQKVAPVVENSSVAGARGQNQKEPCDQPRVFYLTTVPPSQVTASSLKPEEKAENKVAEAQKAEESSTTSGTANSQTTQAAEGAATPAGADTPSTQATGTTPNSAAFNLRHPISPLVALIAFGAYMVL